MSDLGKDRPEENGPQSFHAHTEDRLAEFVQQNATQGDPHSVLATVDKFCWEKHWMMHVGDKKGKILDDILKQYKPNTVLELGTYCGYSAVRIASALPPNGLHFTIDPVQREAAKKIITKAGLLEKVVFLPGSASEVIPTVKATLQARAKTDTVDLVFIDHAKELYLPDLLLIEKAGLLHKGSVVVADNVIVFSLHDYLNHVRTSKNYTSSVNHPSSLEYTTEKGDVPDGIEVSVWGGGN